MHAITIHRYDYEYPYISRNCPTPLHLFPTNEPLASNSLHLDGQKFLARQTFRLAREIPQKLVSEVNKSICHNQFRCKISSLLGQISLFLLLQKPRRN